MNDDLRELYQEVILDHSRRPRNRGELGDGAVHVHGDNPSPKILGQSQCTFHGRQRLR